MNSHRHTTQGMFCENAQQMRQTVRKMIFDYACTDPSYGLTIDIAFDGIEPLPQITVAQQMSQSDEVLPMRVESREGIRKAQTPHPGPTPDVKPQEPEPKKPEPPAEKKAPEPPKKTVTSVARDPSGVLSSSGPAQTTPQAPPKPKRAAAEAYNHGDWEETVPHRAVLRELPTTESYAVQPLAPGPHPGVRLISDMDAGRLFSMLVAQKARQEPSSPSSLGFREPGTCSDRTMRSVSSLNCSSVSVQTDESADEKEDLVVIQAGAVEISKTANDGSTSFNLQAGF